MKTCAFTGHRPKGLGYPESDGRCAALKEKLRTLIIRMMEEEGVTHFISGMAQGVDMYAAEIVLELKKQYPQITLEFMKNNTLDNWVYNKSITKMRESFRVSDEMKSMLKTMVRK